LADAQGKSISCFVQIPACGIAPPVVFKQVSLGNGEMDKGLTNYTSPNVQLPGEIRANIWMNIRIAADLLFSPR
jgi:hypothetical protein